MVINDYKQLSETANNHDKEYEQLVGKSIGAEIDKIKLDYNMIMEKFAEFEHKGQSAEFKDDKAFSLNYPITVVPVPVTAGMVAVVDAVVPVTVVVPVPLRVPPLPWPLAGVDGGASTNNFTIFGGNARLVQDRFGKRGLHDRVGHHAFPCEPGDVELAARERGDHAAHRGRRHGHAQKVDAV